MRLSVKIEIHPRLAAIHLVVSHLREPDYRTKPMELAAYILCSAQSDVRQRVRLGLAENGTNAYSCGFDSYEDYFPKESIPPEIIAALETAAERAVRIAFKVDR